MGERFTIEITTEQAQYLRRIAELSEKPIEDILAEAILHPIPPTDSLDTQLEHLGFYSVSQLWAIVENPVLSEEELAQQEEALERNEKGAATEADKEFLASFSELYNKRGLLRAKALLELQKRGFDVQAFMDASLP